MKMLDESNRKPNKTWVEKGSKLYNISMESQLEKDPQKICCCYKIYQKLMEQNL